MNSNWPSCSYQCRRIVNQPTKCFIVDLFALDQSYDINKLLSMDHQPISSEGVKINLQPPWVRFLSVAQAAAVQYVAALPHGQTRPRTPGRMEKYGKPTTLEENMPTSAQSPSVTDPAMWAVPYILGCGNQAQTTKTITSTDSQRLNKCMHTVILKKGYPSGFCVCCHILPFWSILHLCPFSTSYKFLSFCCFILGFPWLWAIGKGMPGISQNSILEYPRMSWVWQGQCCLESQPGSRFVLDNY